MATGVLYSQATENWASVCLGWVRNGFLIPRHQPPLERLEVTGRPVPRLAVRGEPLIPAASSPAVAGGSSWPTTIGPCGLVVGSGPQSRLGTESPSGPSRLQALLRDHQHPQPSPPSALTPSSQLLCSCSGRCWSNQVDRSFLLPGIFELSASC